MSSNWTCFLKYVPNEMATAVLHKVAKIYNLQIVALCQDNEWLNSFITLSTQNHFNDLLTILNLTSRYARFALPFCSIQIMPLQAWENLKQRNSSASSG